MSKFIENLGFMAWVKRSNYTHLEKKLLKVQSIDFARKMISTKAMGDAFCNFKFNEVFLLPCTGHKDIHDKDLYVGSIVDFNGELFEVTYSDYSGFALSNSRNWTSSRFASGACKIVGNTFENKDLLCKVRGE